MPLIECLLGGQTVDVAGTAYTFERDRANRYVVEVHSLRHVECLLSVEHYRRVDPLAAPQPPAVDAVLDNFGAADPRAADQQQAGAGNSPPATPPDPDTNVDDILRIKGIGKSLKPKLEELGLTSLHHIADMTPETEAQLDAELTLRGRIERDEWIQQAQELVKTLKSVEG